MTVQSGQPAAPGAQAIPDLRAVLFDRDDTIAYTDRGVYREAAAWLAEQYGLDAALSAHLLALHWQEQAAGFWHLRTLDDEEAFWTAYGQGLTLRLGLPAGAAAALLAAFPYERYMKPVPNAHEVLSDLRARGFRVGVLSNTLPSIDSTLRAVGLDRVVDVALASCTLGVHKPDPQAFVLAAQALRCAPEQVLFVDDLPENVAAARRVGMHATLIDLTGRHPEAISDLGQVRRWLP